MSESSIQNAYEAFLAGGLSWDKLWMEVHRHSTICINKLCKKTGARVPPDDRADLITDTDCKVMERLKLKKHIGNVGGVVYFVASGELRNRKLAFANECEESSLDIARGAAVYQCSYPGCPEMVREPGFCREHSPKPRIDGIALTVQQAADELGISERNTWARVNSGIIKSALIGGRRIIKRTDLERYLESIK